jgi:hypothetical protein
MTLDGSREQFDWLAASGAKRLRTRACWELVWRFRSSLWRVTSTASRRSRSMQAVQSSGTTNDNKLDWRKQNRGGRTSKSRAEPLKVIEAASSLTYWSTCLHQAHQKQLPLHMAQTPVPSRSIFQVAKFGRGHQ